MSLARKLEPHVEKCPMDEAQFLDFLEPRPDGERWELIDGEPICTMHPPSLKHQIIGQNLERRLNDALDEQGGDRFAIREIGLSVPDHPGFRPQVDVAMIDGIAQNPYFAERFFLAAEILSDSNTHEFISTKRQRYADHPDCLYVLILGQIDVAVEVWSRANGWQGRVFRSLGDRIELPEFGFSCAVEDLYARTDLARDRGAPVEDDGTSDTAAQGEDERS